MGNDQTRARLVRRHPRTLATGGGGSYEFVVLAGLEDDSYDYRSAVGRRSRQLRPFNCLCWNLFNTSKTKFRERTFRLQRLATPTERRTQRPSLGRRPIRSWGTRRSPWFSEWPFAAGGAQRSLPSQQQTRSGDEYFFLDSELFTTVAFGLGNSRFQSMVT